MKINTLRFGEIDVDDERVFDFIIPIIGFSEIKKFVIVDLKQDSFFKWLQAVDDPGLAFPVVSVFSTDLDYSIVISDEVVEKLKITNVENVLVLNIASIPQDNPQDTSVNLLAPLVFNLEEKVAGQIILSGTGYNISFPLFKKVG